MELKYIVLTIIKILISVPAILLLRSMEAEATALMGGHLNNTSLNSTSTSSSSYLDDYIYEDSQEIIMNETAKGDSQLAATPSSPPNKTEDEQSEEIPDPSPLVLPGYNLPENIFNKGKPFYLEKDPLTGQVDFESRLSSVKLEDDVYDYVEDEPSSDIYDKANIDRKDGSLASHKASDVNQLTPNFHDFLNLPIKYNSDKYVYPLISSSYANTKIQGNVNKYHNHKIYDKPSTHKTTASPTYYFTTESYFPVRKESSTKEKTDSNRYGGFISSTSSTTTTQRTNIPEQKIIKSTTSSTTKAPNLLNSPINHPSFNEEFYDDDYDMQPKPKPGEIHLTTKDVNNIYLTTKAPIQTTTPGTTTTTRKVLSLFEQLFGDYDDSDTMPSTTTTTTTIKPTSKMTIITEKIKPSTQVITNDDNKNLYISETRTEKPSTYSSTTAHPHYPNAHAGPSMMENVNMGLDNSYEYEEDYDSNVNDNIATESKKTPSIYTDHHIDSSRQQSTTSATTTTTRSKTTSHTTTKTTPKSSMKTSEPTTSYKTTRYHSEMPSTTSTTSRSTTIIATASPSSPRATTQPSTVKVTSLPLGENHIIDLNNRQPIIVATQNLREKLGNEKVQPKPFGHDKIIMQNAPSTSNIHIGPNQDTVSFVVGHHQNFGDGQYVGTSIKESPYDSNPFRPLYGQQQYNKDTSVSYTIQNTPEIYLSKPKFPEVAGSAVTIQPLKNSEASLAIGVPVNSIKQKPGQVVDEKLDLEDEKIEFPKGNGPKVIFPDEKDSSVSNLIRPPQRIPQPSLPSKSEILNLNSQPVYHQLPSDLTPPKEQNVIPPPRIERPRPPWDPRPGHFYAGKPEYARPPRPPPEVAYKRIDNLPNILPQFRPNTNMQHGPPPHHFDRFNRQPLLDRPSNRPIGFLERLHPPPPPKNLHNLRKIAAPPGQSYEHRRPGPQNNIERKQDDPPKAITEQFGLYQTPPKVLIANRRVDEDDGEVETLQMIQAKTAENKNSTSSTDLEEESEENNEDEDDDKSLYVVYPVNTPPLKLDVIDNNKKETVVIGTRAELPLPPSKINQQLNYEQNPIFKPKERNDAPVLKPHPKPPIFPVKSDFPYPLERPDPSVLNPPVPETPSNNGNNLDEPNTDFKVEPSSISNNQWNTIGENMEKQKSSTQSNIISATLKNYKEKPIAVAYTPTEPHKYVYDERYSMPNFGKPVIPEIRPGDIIHRHFDDLYGHHFEHKMEIKPPESIYKNHRIDTDIADTPPKLGFQAPFQASLSIDSSKSQGWSVVRDKKTSTTESPEMTTLPLATTSEFDIENFKPELEGGFKPIYTLPSDMDKLKEMDESE